MGAMEGVGQGESYVYAASWLIHYPILALGYNDTPRKILSLAFPT